MAITNLMNKGLIEFIEAHEGCNVVDDFNDSLVVECWATQADGVAFRYQEMIANSRIAALAWLGY
jgi:hypothetical protein